MTDDQKSQIAARLTDGAGIADIQRLINEEFKIHMTYMDVRFLMDDLNLDLAPPPPPEPEATENQPDDQPAANAELVDGVSVEVDRITHPGAAVSGTVTFSDGKGAKWHVDPHGRLGLDPDEEGYQPSPEDVQEFQMELQKQMQGPEA